MKKGGAAKVLGLSGAALSVTKSVITIIAATVTIIFLTFFMLLEGRDWIERFYALFPEDRSRAGDASATTSTRRSAATSPATS